MDGKWARSSQYYEKYAFFVSDWLSLWPDDATGSMCASIWQDDDGVWCGAVWMRGDCRQQRDLPPCQTKEEAMALAATILRLGG